MVKLDITPNGTLSSRCQYAGMARQAWAGAFSAAYADFCRRVDAADDGALDPDAAESPAELFAVASEAFFETPDAALRHLSAAVPTRTFISTARPGGARPIAVRRNQVSFGVMLVPVFFHQIPAGANSTGFGALLVLIISWLHAARQIPADYAINQ